MDSRPLFASLGDKDAKLIPAREGGEAAQRQQDADNSGVEPEQKNEVSRRLKEVLTYWSIGCIHHVLT